MSRYIKEIPGNKILAYGFDHALGYWYDISNKDDNVVLLEEESSVLTGLRNRDFADILIKYDVDEDKVNNVLVDLEI